MKESLLRKARESAEVAARLVEAESGAIEACVRDMATRFERGGKLWTMGNGGSACDAQHVAIEFMHPILEKRRPLPAQALTVDTAALTSIGNDSDFALVFAEPLRIQGRDRDVALGISTSGQSANVLRGIEAAREIGMLTVGFAGRDGGRLADLAEHCFVAPSFSIHRIQETHTLLLHLLWDMVHVALGEEDVV